MTIQRANAAGSGADCALLTRPIPSTGETLPAIGLGTWQTFDVAPSARAGLEGVLGAFVELGGRYRLLADVQTLEEVVGDLRRSASVDLPWPPRCGRRRARRRPPMEDSMRKLGRHRPRADPNLVDVDTHLDTLAEWKREGRVRYVGVTHYTAGHHDAVARIIAARPVDFVQINYSVGEREAESRLLPLARERGMAVLANRPFAGGDLFRRLRSRPLPAWAAEIDCTSWAQVLLKFVISHTAITCAIPATSQATHLRDNMQAAHGRLPDAALRARIAAEAV
jgi:diketogulonate reductase-like aldo/keto reductase